MSNTISRLGSQWAAQSRHLRRSTLTVVAALAAFGGVAATTGASAQAASAPAKYTSTVRLTGTRSGKPTLKVIVSDKVKGGRKITRVVITLPKGYRFNKNRFSGHVRVQGVRFQDGVHNGALTIDPMKPAAKLIIDVNHVAIIESRSARHRRPGKVKLRVTELSRSKHPGGGGNGNAIKDLETTITNLIADLRGLGTGSDPLLKLVGTLGQAVDDIGQTVSALGNDLKAVEGGKYGKHAQSNLTKAEAALKAGLADLAAGNTSGATAEFQKAAADFRKVLAESGSRFPGAGGLKQLIKELETISKSLGGIGSGVGSGSAGTPAQALEMELQNLVKELGSNTGTAPLAVLLSAVVSTVDSVVGDLTGVSGHSQAGHDFIAAAVLTQQAITDLRDGKTAAAKAALKKAEADIEAGAKALPLVDKGLVTVLVSLVSTLDQVVTGL